MIRVAGPIHSGRVGSAGVVQTDRWGSVMILEGA